MGDEAGPRVVVVGAGLAGLAAAWHLRAEGCDVRVLERSARAGGAAAPREREGFHLEGPVSWLSSGDRRLLAWIDALSLTDRMRPFRPLHVAQIHRGRADAIDEDRVLGLARIRGLRVREALRVLRLPRLMRRYGAHLDAVHPERAAPLDSRSVADFAKLYFGPTVLERWIAPAVSQASGDDERDLSRIVFLLQYQASQHARPVVPRAGLHAIVDEAAARLDLRTDQPAESLETLPDDRGFRVFTGGDTVEADAVVLAVCAREAGRLTRGLATPAERDFFAASQVRPVSTLWAALDRPLTGVPQLVRVPRRESSPLASYLLEPGAADGRAPTGYGLATLVARVEHASAQRDAADEVVSKELGAALVRLHPWASIRFAELRRSEIPHFGVGAFAALARFRAVQADRRAQGRRLYYAGDHLAGLRAEDRIGSGIRAARELLADLGHGRSRRST